MSSTLSRRIRRLPLQPAHRDSDRIDLLAAAQELRNQWKGRRLRRTLGSKEARRA